MTHENKKNTKCDFCQYNKTWLNNHLWTTASHLFIMSKSGLVPNKQGKCKYFGYSDQTNAYWQRITVHRAIRISQKLLIVIVQLIASLFSCPNVITLSRFNSIICFAFSKVYSDAYCFKNFQFNLFIRKLGFGSIQRLFNYECLAYKKSPHCNGCLVGCGYSTWLWTKIYINKI